MKTILLFSMFILICNLNVNSSNKLGNNFVDSTTLYMWMDIKSIKIDTNNLDRVLISEIPHTDGWFDWVGDLWDWATQPFRPVWGWYEEGGNKINSPYTTFDLAYSESKIAEIRLQIGSYPPDEIYKEFYFKAYELAISTTTRDDIRAKCAAFIYLVGLTQNADSTLTTSTVPTRESFKEIAKTCLVNIDTRNSRFTDPNDGQWQRAIELMNYLQAYDFLSYGHRIQDQIFYDKDKIEDDLHTFTYELYSEANNYDGALRRYNNLSIIVAGAVGMAAIVLHHHGTYLWLIQQKPDRWAQAAHAYINLSMFTINTDGNTISLYTNGPESERGNMTGFAEGPGYFGFCFQTAIPFFRSFNNFVNNRAANYTIGSEEKFGPYYQSALGDWTGQKINNYLHDPDYKNLFKWYVEILEPNGNVPTTDDTWPHTSIPIEIAGYPYRYGDFSGKLNTAVRPYEYINFEDCEYLIPDYLGVNNLFQQNIKRDNPVNLYTAGSIIFRTTGKIIDTVQRSIFNQHSLHVSCENKLNLNGKKAFNFGHEHGDATSFIITAGEDNFAIDPAYYRYENRFDVNQGDHHNVITGNRSSEYGPADNTTTYLIKAPITKGDFSSCTVAASYQELTVYRTFNVNSHYDWPLYTIIDSVHANDYVFARFNLNGNGTIGSSFKINHNTVLFNYPCQKEDSSATKNSDNWQLLVTSSIVFDTLTIIDSIDFQTGSTHGFDDTKYPRASKFYASDYGNITKYSGTSNGASYGEHTRAFRESFICPGKSVKYLTLLEPIPCTMDPELYIPKVGQTIAHTKQSVKRGHDNILMYVRTKGGISNDSVINPYDIEKDSQIVMKTNANYVNLRNSDTNYFKSGNCDSRLFFREVSIENGSLLKFNDTNYIEASSICNVSYRITGKYKYAGSVSTNEITTIKFCIPDVDRGYKMIAKWGVEQYDTLPSRHREDSGWTYIEIDFPLGSTSFTIELEDPCRLSCFFPSTIMTIDTIFEFNTGTTENLSHDLDDVNGNGNLRITNGSKMSICSDMVFHNFDSIVMGGCKSTPLSVSEVDPGFFSPFGEGTEFPPPNMAPMDSLGQNRIGNSDRNMIIVNEKASLVLDSGSHTHIGAYSTILIRKNGTLYVKANAHVEVGSDCHYDRGELIAEAGSYICVEEGADMHFFNDLNDTNIYHKDTVDRNIVYIRNDNAGSGEKHANNGVNTDGASGKFNEDSIFGDHECVAFCSWKYVNPEFGVNNREFGWCNISYPVSRFTSADTACYGIPYRMNGIRSINEIAFYYFVHEYDTSTHTSSDENLSTTAYPVYGQIKDSQNVFTPSDAGYFEVGLTTYNDCGENNTTSKIVYVPPVPSVTFNIPDSACSGYGMIKATGQNTSFNGLLNKRYVWKVHMLIPDSMQTKLGFNAQNSAGWEFDSTAIRDSFDFPGFNWLGGFKYSVSLSLNGYCSSTTITDTILIPFIARIDLSGTHMTYEEPIGPSAFKMEAVSLGDSIQSFKWIPTSYLDDSTSKKVIASPPGTIQYILEATNGVCVDHDTVNVVHNTITIAGNDMNICNGSAGVLGTNFDGPLFLGFMDYIAPYDFIDLYENYDSLVPFDNNFTTFMLKKLKGSTEAYVNSNPAVLTFMAIDSIRQLIHSRSWYTDYINDYNTLSSPIPGSTDAIHRFGNVYLPADTLVKALLDNLGLDWASTNGFMEGLMNDYYNWYISGDYHSTNVNWDCFRDDEHCPDGSYMQGNFNPIVSPPLGKTTYRITVTDPELSVVEYDYVDVITDTIITPLFQRILQTDSTVYLHNLSSPVNSESTSYKWNFGDGDSAINIDPIHTFTHFDQGYLVCLTAINTCGQQTYCDSIYVDSIGLINTEHVFNDNNPLTNLNELERASSLDLQRKTFNKNEYFLSNNYPNPFSNWTVIEYSIIHEGKRCEIHLYNTLGQELMNFNLKNNKGLLLIDGSELNSGMYYYSLIVDGTVIKSKPMVVAH